ncbi:MAG: bifunctional oligoribonuclease/PAP phosphatase NrnA [Acholeplasmataceae bacterium]|jgi:phosphoesterase RecJ-like protein|nr:bifunctional oligoribonuclease/PAP phosphatase NrnA [Acholeplasmataceae bacterium]
MINSILNKFKEYDTIIIHRHNRPDGDALGSQVGLKEALSATYPEKKILITGDENERYQFIGRMDDVKDEDYQGALVVVLDTPEENMISDDRFRKGDFLIKIDHHIPRTGFGDLQLVDTSYESCAGLVAHLIFENGLKLTDNGAQALYVGIVTDSGRFRFDSVTPRTFEDVAKLIRYSFNINDIYSNLYLEDLKMVKLRAKFITNFKLTPHNVAYTKTTADELKEYNTDIFTISRGMVNTMGGIKGIDIWANFTEDEENKCIIAELRSNKYNINQIAVKYGGGGHQLASGATLKSFEEADMMLADLDNLIKENE